MCFSMDKQTKKNINKCLIEIKNGNSKYVDILYYLVCNELKYIALKYLRNEEEVKDVMQDFWADVYKNAKNYRYIENGYSYLCKIITRMSINRYKKVRGERNHTTEEAETNYIVTFDEDTIIEKLDYKIAVQKALEELNPIERVVMLLIIYDDKTIEQISEDLRMSKSAVGRIKLSAEEKLKKELVAMNLGKK